MSCDDQISTQDLINAKDDATALGEVATSRAGAESGGAPITQATNRFGEVTDTVQGRLNKLGVLYDDPIKDWSAGLLVSDLRAHRYPATTGDIYIPVIPLPFTTGGTFNTNDWVLLNGYSDLQIINTISDVAVLYFETITSMVAGNPDIDYQVNMNLKVNGENDEFTNYVVVNAVSDVDLGGGLWAKKLRDSERTTSDEIPFERRKAQSTGVALQTNQSVTDVQQFAHRGLGYTASDTISEFSYALAQGADGLEIDIQMTSDGVPVCYHDDTLDTITNGTGAVGDNTLAQVQAARFTSTIGTVFENDRIPTIQEILNLIRDSGCKLIYEVKNFRTLADIDDYVQLALDNNLEKDIYFASFELTEVQQMIDYHDDISILRYTSTPSNARYDELANLTNKREKVLAASAGSALTKDMVEYGNSVGVSTLVWTTTSKGQMLDKKRLGVNMFVTDSLYGNMRGTN